MDLSVTRHAQSYDQIRNNPKFRQLAQSRSRLAWSLSAAVLGTYFLFMATVAFAPELLHRPLAEGSPLTVGLPVGAAVIVLSWLLTGWYVRSANTRFDALNAELIEESRQ